LHPPTLIHREQLDGRRARERARDQVPAVPVLDQVAAELVDHERELALLGRVEPDRGGEADDLPARLAHLARLGDHERARGALDDHFHLVMRTRVPWPGADAMSNSLERRRAPPSPRPRPSRAGKTYRSACATSPLPGPLSSQVRGSPRRPPSWSASNRVTPPPPWISVLRASS